MADNNQQRSCTGNCLKCGIQQRMYCSSQHAYNVEKMLENLMSRFDGLEDTVSKLDDKVNALQADAGVFNPNEDNQAFDDSTEGEAVQKEIDFPNTNKMSNK